MRDQLEILRGLGESAPENSRVLLDERGEDIPRRVKAFIDLLVRAGHLDLVRETGDEDVWQQTLLGALEAEQIGVHHLTHLIALTAAEGSDGERLLATAETPDAEAHSQSSAAEEGEANTMAADEPVAAEDEAAAAGSQGKAPGAQEDEEPRQ